LPAPDPAVIVMGEENVLLPAKVCEPVVTIPALVPLAGAKLNTPAVIVPPLAVDEPPIAPIVVATVPVDVEPSAIKYCEEEPAGVLNPAAV